MLKRLKASGRNTETWFLFFLCCLCFVLSLFRVFYSDTVTFLFLNWNLFLAFIPWFLTSLAILYPKLVKSKFSLIILIAIWLLFFPNAPYILTDLFHLRLNSSMPIWYDLILILSFAWTGLLFGLLSLWDIENVQRQRIKKRFVFPISISLLFLGSFGIYIGRYLRWNSWGILNEPITLLYDIGDRLINPFNHPRTWGVTLLMGVFLNVVYASFKLIKSRNHFTI
ncbi:MAG TPA: DUF1361 domain-containing protein [Bacteroidales bacterium]|nr:DUF1361 domain-containing protein [Bacteroidales bacterium]